MNTDFKCLTYFGFLIEHCNLHYCRQSKKKRNIFSMYNPIFEFVERLQLNLFYFQNTVFTNSLLQFNF